MLIWILSFAFSSQTWLFVGDSLTEGYGLSKESAYPYLLEQKWNATAKNKIKTINAGISGSTSSSGLSRVRYFAKKYKVDLLLIALGANDGLRGQSTDKLAENLKGMIDFAKQNKWRVVLVGMKMPQNYGKVYTQEFAKVYQSLAKQEKVIFYPFLLEGVAGNAKLNLKDGLHPNEKGYEVIAQRLYEFMRLHYDKTK